MPEGITFILPTRNRGQWVQRAADSCLQADRPECPVHLLIIEGNGEDGSFEKLQSRYGGDARVEIVRQTGAPGFMAACFLGVPMVKTPLATFMYDDDVLSPFWAEMPAEMRRRGGAFVMGCGVRGSLETLTALAPVERIIEMPVRDILQGFFGWGRQLSQHPLPFNPICCVTQTQRLREWAAEVAKFAKGHSLREYFMLQRAAGPDLMIYLHSIARQSGKIILFDGAVAQFSVHDDSLTSSLESSDLAIGYWLAQVWLCRNLIKREHWAEAGRCGGYAVRQGFRLLLKRLEQRRHNWLGALTGEVAALTARLFFSPAVFHFVTAFVIFLLPRKWRPLPSMSVVLLRENPASEGEQFAPR